jgi:CheY-like chemotaxis protein
MPGHIAPHTQKGYPMRHAFIAFLVATLLVACGSSAASQTPDADATGKSSKSMRIGGSIHVLVVDDSKFTVRMFWPLRKEDGYVMHTAENGEMAMKFLNDTPLESRPDIIFVDDTLPDQDADQFVRTMTSDERYKDIPVVMILGEKFVYHLHYGLQNGASGFLQKPFRAEDLVSITERRVSGQP